MLVFYCAEFLQIEQYAFSLFMGQFIMRSGPIIGVDSFVVKVCPGAGIEVLRPRHVNPRAISEGSFTLTTTIGAFSGNFVVFCVKTGPVPVSIILSLQHPWTARAKPLHNLLFSTVSKLPPPVLRLVLGPPSPKPDRLPHLLFLTATSYRCFLCLTDVASKLGHQQLRFQELIDMLLGFERIVFVVDAIEMEALGTVEGRQGGGVGEGTG